MEVERSFAPGSTSTFPTPYIPVIHLVWVVEGGASLPSTTKQMNLQVYKVLRGGNWFGKEEAELRSFLLPKPCFPRAVLRAGVKQVSFLGKEETCFSPALTSTPGITGLTFLRIASPRVGKVPPCRLQGLTTLRFLAPRPYCMS